MPFQINQVTFCLKIFHRSSCIYCIGWKHPPKPYPPLLLLPNRQTLHHKRQLRSSLQKLRSGSYQLPLPMMPSSTHPMSHPPRRCAPFRKILSASLSGVVKLIIASAMVCVAYGTRTSVHMSPGHQLQKKTQESLFADHLRNEKVEIFLGGPFHTSGKPQSFVLLVELRAEWVVTHEGLTFFTI